MRWTGREVERKNAFRKIPFASLSIAILKLIFIGKGFVQVSRLAHN